MNLTRLIDHRKTLENLCGVPYSIDSHCNWKPCTRVRQYIIETSELKDQMLTIMAEALENIRHDGINPDATIEGASGIKVNLGAWSRPARWSYTDVATKALSRVNELAGKAMEGGK